MTARRVEFGISVVPAATELDAARAAVLRADELGVDLVGVQDHPYQARFVETFALLGDLLARTERIRAFPDVANLPLRDPALLAKQAATIDLLSGGRFELGLGAGASREGVAAMGGPVRAAAESVEALEEAIALIRLAWSGERSIDFEGRFYRVRGWHPGPEPAHAIGIWIGAYGPRMLALTGRAADGWVPSLPYAPPERIPSLRERVDEAALAAGRDPAEIRRVYNLMGEITDGTAESLLRGPVEHWVEQLVSFVEELRFDTLVFWPRRDPLRQVERFAAEVVPRVREAVEVPLPPPAPHSPAADV